MRKGCYPNGSFEQFSGDQTPDDEKTAHRFQKDKGDCTDHFLLREKANAVYND